MKIWLASAILWMTMCNVASAQRRAPYRFMAYRELQSPDPGFGGISAIEYLDPEAVRALIPEMPLGQEKTKVFILISDHDPSDGKSHVFTMDSSFRIKAGPVFVPHSNIESFRYNGNLRKAALAFEEKQVTGVHLLSPDTAGNRMVHDMVLAEDSIPDRNTSGNRGIEGITFDADNNLWLAYESGGDTSCNKGTIPFYRYLYDKTTAGYDTSGKSVYRYPFDRCSCMEPSQRFNGWVGNGVSEILSIPGKPGMLLVLERCFDGNTGSVKLYTAAVQEGSTLLVKQLAFDFNNKDNFDMAHKDFVPDNIEGMSWGPLDDGYPVLYLVSDNNFRKSKQKNQVIKLKMYAK